MFEPPYKWIVSFDEGVYSFEVFATTIDVRAVVASKVTTKSPIGMGKTRPVAIIRQPDPLLGAGDGQAQRIRRRTPASDGGRREESAEEENNDEEDEGCKHWTGDDTCT